MEGNMKLHFLFTKQIETTNKEKTEILDFLPDGAIIFKVNDQTVDFAENNSQVSEKSQESTNGKRN